MARRMSHEDDLRLRHQAQQFLEVRTNDGADPIHREELLNFEFDGARIPLIDNQMGIRKPASTDAAISITTTYTPPGRSAPYEDRIDPKTGLLVYKWQGRDPDRYDNVGLRVAMQRKLPLTWFFGIAPSVYMPVFPMYIIAENSDAHEFVLSVQPKIQFDTADSAAEQLLKGYRIQETMRRVHQPLFSQRVMEAYNVRCAVCGIAHRALLDAAHIIPDADIRGIPEVRNGLSLCKIHHAAFDANILGVTADYETKIRQDILEEIDGPMLKHGLQERHNENLRVVPRAALLRPDREFLAERYSQFLDAG